MCTKKLYRNRKGMSCCLSASKQFRVYIMAHIIKLGQIIPPWNVNNPLKNLKGVLLAGPSNSKLITLRLFIAQALHIKIQMDYLASQLYVLYYRNQNGYTTYYLTITLKMNPYQYKRPLKVFRNILSQKKINFLAKKRLTLILPYTQ